MPEIDDGSPCDDNIDLAGAPTSAVIQSGRACIRSFREKRHSQHGKRGIELLTHVLTTSSASSDSYMVVLHDLGDIYEFARMPTQAIALYEKHLQRVDSRDTNIRTRLGVVYLRSEKKHEARQELNRVLQQDPQNPRANAYLGLMLKLEGRLQEAAELMKVCYLYLSMTTIIYCVRVAAWARPT